MSNHPEQDKMDRDLIKDMPEHTREALNADPITGEPGSHPVGTGVGATGGAVAGATVGLVGGPLGSLIGGAIGAVVGGLAGHKVGEAMDPTQEEAYWREAHTTTAYYTAADDYNRDYASAYRLGYQARSEYDRSSSFDDVESDLGQR